MEFGAWDGISGSNTFNLINSFGYRGVLIEPDNAKFAGLMSNLADSKHYKFNEYVGLDNHNKLDSILQRTEIPSNFDFLSIDIDGMDYFVWESLQNYHPKIVCIEFNPTIPEHIFFVQPPTFALSQGSSPMSLISLASEKGYELVSATDCNLIFVASELFKLVTGSNQSLNYPGVAPPRIVEEVFIFSGYDGTLILSKELILPWHNLKIKPLGLQYLPKRIRQFPLNYSLSERLRFYFFKVRKTGFTWGTKYLTAKIVSWFSHTTGADKVTHDHYMISCTPNSATITHRNTVWTPNGEGGKPESLYAQRSRPRKTRR